jgi:hypothetical protein
MNICSPLSHAFSCEGFDLRITTTDFEETRYSIKGYIATNVELPAAAFAPQKGPESTLKRESPCENEPQRVN